MNTKQKLLLVISIAAISLTSRGQNLHLTWGPSLPNPPRTSDIDIIGQDAAGFYVVRFKGGGMFSNASPYLERYDNKMNKVFSNEIVVTNTNGKDLNYEGLFYLQGKLLIFSSYFNKDLDKNFCFVQSVNAQGALGKDMKEIDAITAVKKRNAGGFNFALSDDSTKILLYHDEPYEKNEPERFSFKVMDNTLNPIWSKSISLPYKDQNFSTQRYRVDKDANVYILGKLFKDRSQLEKGSPDFKYVILTYFHQNDRFKEYDVSLGDKFISDMTFRLDKNNNLIGAGFYSNKSTSAIIGTFYLRIDGASKEVVAKGTKDFSTDFLEQFMSASKASKKKELWNYDMDNLVLRDDGGAVLIAEQWYVVVVRNYNPQTHSYTYTYYYHYNDIIAVSINPDASIAWAIKIPKKQLTTNDGGYASSYAFAVVKDKMFFIYNDNPKNITITDPKKLKTMTKPNSSGAVLVTVDSDGKRSKKFLYSSKLEKVTLVPSQHLQANETDLLIYGARFGKYKFGRVSFE